MERSYTIQVSHALARNPLVRLAAPADFSLLPGEQLAIMGPNAGGKSLLVDLIIGKYPLLQGRVSYDFGTSPWREVYHNIRYIAFRDTYGSADTNYYYQQRWHSTEQDDVPLVRNLLGDYEENPLQRQLFDMFHMDELLEKPIIQLSSGEMRKFQITRMLLQQPCVLIMDNPFIGLDAGTRDQLSDLLRQLTTFHGLQIVLVLSMLDSVPEFVTHVLPVDHLTVGEKVTRQQYLAGYAAAQASSLADEEPELAKIEADILHLPYESQNYTGNEVVRLNKATIRYGTRTILRDLDWTVARGEKWALSGDNGSGKSTLLSLVCADNPQSYACDIRLFGRKRGTGESIWEIKKHIGYVCPEMHRSYLKDLPAIDIVASGLHDSIGLYVHPRPGQTAICRWWMNIFGIGHLAEKTFLRLSSGEQRLVLLARAFVKDPELLILDEPLHGLDTRNRRRVKRIIEAFCHRTDKTMIMVTHYAEELPRTIDHSLHLVKIV